VTSKVVQVRELDRLDRIDALLQVRQRLWRHAFARDNLHLNDPVDAQTATEKVARLTHDPDFGSHPNGAPQRDQMP
jgi:hypothetical protein